MHDRAAVDECDAAVRARERRARGAREDAHERGSRYREQEQARDREAEQPPSMRHLTIVTEVSRRSFRVGRRVILATVDDRSLAYPAAMTVHGPLVDVTITDQTGAGRVTATTCLEGIASETSLRDLIRTRVREEVAKFNAGPADVFRGLVMPDEAEQTPDGYRLRQPRRIDWEKQADLAVGAFARNGFFVLVDGRQVAELDAPLNLTADTDIRFVRLVQLVGG